MWFGMFTFGMFFVNYLAATSILIPFFRAVTKPLRAMPGVVGAAIASIVGVGVGWGLSELVASVLLQDQVAAVQDSWAQVTSAPAVAVPIALAITIVPILVGLVLEARQERREQA
jgi:hypothetical protein